MLYFAGVAISAVESSIESSDENGPLIMLRYLMRRVVSRVEGWTLSRLMGPQSTLRCDHDDGKKMMDEDYSAVYAVRYARTVSNGPPGWQFFVIFCKTVLFYRR